MPVVSRVGAIGFLLGVLTIVASPARAEPFEVPDLGAAEDWELELVLSHEDVGGEQMSELPAIGIAAPILPGLELSVATARGRIEHESGNVHRGYSDLELALKYEVIPSREGRVGLTVEPALALPTGDRHFTESSVQLALPIVAGVAYGDWELRALAAYAVCFEACGDSIAWGGLFKYRITSSLALGTEMVAEAPVSNLSSPDVIANFGFILEPSDRFELSGRVGHSVQRSDGRRGFSALLLTKFTF